jgi:hypothetical protein
MTADARPRASSLETPADQTADDPDEDGTHQDGAKQPVLDPLHLTGQRLRSLPQDEPGGHKPGGRQKTPQAVDEEKAVPAQGELSPEEHARVPRAVDDPGSQQLPRAQALGEAFDPRPHRAIETGSPDAIAVRAPKGKPCRIAAQVSGGADDDRPQEIEKPEVGQDPSDEEADVTLDGGDEEQRHETVTGQKRFERTHRR